MSKSSDGRKRNGGAGRGAGRKAKLPRVVSKATAERILSQIDEVEHWLWCIKKDRKTGNTAGVRESLKYLTDRRDGKAAQAIMVEGKTPLRIIVGFNGTNGDDPTA